MLFILTSEVLTDSLSQLTGAEQPIGLSYPSLTMYPLGFYGVEPGTSAGERTLHNAHPLSVLFDPLVMFCYPLSYLSADMPGGVVPDQQKCLFAQSQKLVAAPLKEGYGNPADRATVHKAQPSLLMRVPLVCNPTHQKPEAGQCLWVGVTFGYILFHQA